MKKLFILSFLSMILFSCSSLELEAVSSSEEETQKILALGLSHEENLVEASKLKSKHMKSVVTLQLNNARDEKIQYQSDLIESEKLAEMVTVSNEGLSYTGPKVSSIISNILSTSPVLQNYYIKGSKGSINESIEHLLNITYIYNSNKGRNYSSANLCDEWGRCETLLQKISDSSLNFDNCSSSSCDYIESFELNLSDEILRNSINKGLTIKLISKNDTDKVNISVAYLMGYLKVAK
jgi:hypothetical protein